jgi:hypothetical protein
MKRRLLILCAAVIWAQDAGFTGSWIGEIEAGPARRRIGFRIGALEAGKLPVAVESLDQHASVPVTGVETAGSRITVTMSVARFEGALSPDRQTIEGTFTQGGVSYPLELKRTQQIPEARRPQLPRPPFPYNVEEVKVENGAAGVTLGGTMTSPRGTGPFPAVALLTGSGAQDRDETLFGHKPFLVIADHLTRIGFAVLRVDDRGVGNSTGTLEGATDEDLTGDALACVGFLESRKEVDRRQIGLVGHSQGATVASIAATRSEKVAFIVMLAGPGVRGDQLLREQGIEMLRARNAPQSAVDRQVELQSAMFRIVEDEKNPAAAEARLRQLLGGTPHAETQIRRVNSPEMRFMLRYDPASTLKQLRRPVLAMNGTNDRQVWYQQNLPAIAAALAESRTQDYAILALPGLNHLFQTSRTGSPQEYGEIEETFAPSALQAMSDWLRRHVALAADRQ